MTARETRRWARPLWNVGGYVFLALGALGVPLPVLPTTPFLLLSAACFLRGSPRMHAWMVTNRYFGRYLAEYRAGLGVPLHTKVGAIVFLWLGIGVSATLFVTSAVGRGALLAIVLVVTAHILMIRTKRDASRPAGAAVQPPVRLVDLAAADWPLVERWLEHEHVRRWWGDPAATLGELRARAEGTRLQIIEAGERKTGLVVWGHPSPEELAEAGLDDVSQASVDVDIMIGESEALGRGIGTETLRQVTERALADPSVPYVIAAAAAGNGASLRAFVKAGFRVVREFDDPEWGPCLLLRFDRLMR